MTNWTYDTADKRGVLSVEGDLTIANVAELKERLVEAFHDADEVTIDVSGSTGLDVAGIQLLCACHSYSCKAGKAMNLEIGDNQGFTEFINGVGFARNFVCNKGGGACLWNNND